jgi:hypothetical protein
MKTLSEIEQAEATERERAWRFERLTNDVERLQKQIAKLEGATHPIDMLEELHRLAGLVPANVTTRGNRQLPGGFLARQLLIEVTGDVLADVKRKADAEQTVLAKARVDLVAAQAALAAISAA